MAAPEVSQKKGIKRKGRAKATAAASKASTSKSQPNPPVRAAPDASTRVPKGPTYAELHGKGRGCSAAHDGLRGPPSQPPLNAEAADEGLLVFVQTTRCRRIIWNAVFESPTKGTP